METLMKNNKILNCFFKIIEVKNMLLDKDAEKYSFCELLLCEKVKHVIFPFCEKQVKTSY